MVLLAVLAVAAGAVTRMLRRPSGPMSRRPVRGLAALAAGAGLELIAAQLLSGTASVTVSVTGYAFLCAFGFANVAHPGMILVLAGLLANSAVIVVNDGMPVAGRPAGAASGSHHGLQPGDHLSALADVVPVLSERLSPGDVVVSLGGAVAMFAWAPSRQRRVA